MKKIIIFLFVCTSCSVNKFIVQRVSVLLNKGSTVFETETDYDLAKIALASNMKLLEAFYINDEKNYKLAILLSKVMATYAFAYLEINLEVDNLKLQKRCNRLYKKSMHYALKALNKRKLNEHVLESDRIEALAWLAFSLARFILLNMEDVEYLSKQGLLVDIINKIIKKQPRFYHGLIYIIAGSYESFRIGLGGNKNKARLYFEKAFKVDNQFLLTKVLYAKYFLVKMAQKKKFIKILKMIEKSTPKYLSDSVAIRMAKKLLRQVDDFFI